VQLLPDDVLGLRAAVGKERGEREMLQHTAAQCNTLQECKAEHHYGLVL